MALETTVPAMDTATQCFDYYGTAMVVVGGTSSACSSVPCCFDCSYCTCLCYIEASTLDDEQLINKQQSIVEIQFDGHSYVHQQVHNDGINNASYQDHGTVHCIQAHAFTLPSVIPNTVGNRHIGTPGNQQQLCTKEDLSDSTIESTALCYLLWLVASIKTNSFGDSYTKHRQRRVRIVSTGQDGRTRGRVLDASALTSPAF